MKKNKYETPEIKVVCFEYEDITASAFRLFDRFDKEQSSNWSTSRSINI